MPSTTTSPGTPVPTPTTTTSALAVLGNLDRYMVAAGYDVDHPWRVEIASVAGAGNAAADAVEDIVMVNGLVNSLLVLALQELAKSDAESKAMAAIVAARRYVADIDSAAAFLTGSVA